MMTMRTNYFYGNEVSEYGKEHGYVDYETLAKAFDAVMSNDIIEKTDGKIGYWEQISGMIDNREKIEELEERINEFENEQPYFIDICNDSEKVEKYERIESKIDELKKEIDELETEECYPPEIYQYYIVDDNGAQILEEVEEIVFYNDELDMYVWGVTHFGTSWDYVLTNIKIDL